MVGEVDDMMNKREGTVRRISVVALLVLAIAVGAGCPHTPKGELEQARPAKPGVTEETGQQGQTGGERGEVTSSETYGLKPVYFDFDKYNLREDARAGLDANADILQKNPDIRIVIEGNCDERGTDEYNMALGERRARAAQDYLVRLGIDASRITIISYGEERPVALGHDEDSWRLNRRDEFVPKK